MELPNAQALLEAVRWQLKWEWFDGGRQKSSLSDFGRELGQFTRRRETGCCFLGVLHCVT